MNTWHVRFMEDGNEIAEQKLGDLPAVGEEVVIQDTIGLNHGGNFEVVKVRRVYGNSPAHTAVHIAIAGGPFEVHAHSAYVHLRRIP